MCEHIFRGKEHELPAKDVSRLDSDWNLLMSCLTISGLVALHCPLLHCPPLHCPPIHSHFGIALEEYGAQADRTHCQRTRTVRHRICSSGLRGDDEIRGIRMGGEKNCSGL